MMMIYDSKQDNDILQFLIGCQKLLILKRYNKFKQSIYFIPEVKPRSQYSAAIKIQTPAMISLQAKSIDTDQNFNFQLRIQLKDNFINYTIQDRKSRYSQSLQPTTLQSSKIYRKFIDPKYITRSIDYSELGDSQIKTKKKNPQQNQRLNRQFQAIYNKMKLILDSYNNRERILIQYIAKLKQEIITLKQGYNHQTI